MTITQRHEFGNFCWIDLSTKDPAQAKRFYGELFGWSFTDNPGPEGMTYTMVQHLGKNVAGMFKEDSPEVHPHWNAYVRVKNADETVEKAKKAGGKIISPNNSGKAWDVMDQGRMALLQDPSGAIVGIWEGKKHTGAEVFEQPSTLAWNEILTNDTAKAKEFFPKVFGWKVHDEKEMHYTLFMQGEPEYHTGGLMQIDPNWGPVPPAWHTYFAVENADKSVEKAKKLGARVNHGPMDIPNVGRFAMLMDPGHAPFSIIQSFRKL
jgi:predicted enzyme related to lactoylglutathione lyase